MTTRTLDLADGDFGDLPTDFTHLLHLVADFSADDYDRALRVNAEGTGFVLEHCRNAKAALVMSTVTRLQAAPRSVARLPRGRSARRRDGAAVGAVLGDARSRRRAWRATAPVRSACPTTIARMGAAYSDQSGLPVWHLDAVAAGEPVHTRWDPMTYSPIHDDDICAHLEPLLDAATVPATIVNWAGDEPVSVQEYSAFFGELLGVAARGGGDRDPGRVGRVGRPTHTKRAVDHGSVHGRLARRLPARRRALLPRACGGADVSAGAAEGFPDVDTLLAEAAASTGLDDFGPGDFREGLAVLLESYERDTDFSPAARADVVDDLRRRLTNRLEVGGVVRRSTRRSTTSRCSGPVDINGLPAHGHDRAGQHAVARPAVPQPAAVGTGATVPAADARRRGHRSPSPAARTRRTTRSRPS